MDADGTIGMAGLFIPEQHGLCHLLLMSYGNSQKLEEASRSNRYKKELGWKNELKWGTISIKNFSETNEYC